MILIGNYFSGPEHDSSQANRVLSNVMRIAKELRGSFEVGDGPAVNVVFCVPGSLGGPDWDWLQEARFSKKKKLLLVQVAVPPDVVEAPALKEFAIKSLRGANAIAFLTFNEKGMTFPLKEAEQFVTQIKERLANSPDLGEVNV